MQNAPRAHAAMSMRHACRCAPLTCSFLPFESFQESLLKNDGTNHIFGLVLTITMILLAAHIHIHMTYHMVLSLLLLARELPSGPRQAREPPNHRTTMREQRTTARLSTSIPRIEVPNLA